MRVRRKKVWVKCEGIRFAHAILGSHDFTREHIGRSTCQAANTETLVSGLRM